MKKLQITYFSIAILMINTLLLVAMNENNAQLQKNSWFSWFKSYIPGTYEYSLRRNNNSKENNVSQGMILEFYVKCDELKGSLVDSQTSQVRSDIDFNKILLVWRKELIEILKAWEVDKDNDNALVNQLRQKMYYRASAAIDQVRKDAKNLTRERLNFLSVVEESLYNRIVKNI